MVWPELHQEDNEHVYSVAPYWLNLLVPESKYWQNKQQACE